MKVSYNKIKSNYLYLLTIIVVFLRIHIFLFTSVLQKPFSYFRNTWFKLLISDV